MRYTLSALVALAVMAGPRAEMRPAFAAADDAPLARLDEVSAVRRHEHHHAAASPGFWSTVRAWLATPGAVRARTAAGVTHVHTIAQTGRRPVRTAALETGCSGRRVVAAWYQSGRHTASGAAFNPRGLTAAHRSLPFGSHVTVTNPRNGRSVTVVINDRGPFVRGVTIDLARGAAESIGMRGTQAVCMS